MKTFLTLLITHLFILSIQAKPFIDSTNANSNKITYVSQGEDMPDWNLINIEDQTCRLSDYLGKYILLCFWDIHCRHCINSMPELGEISTKYKDQLTIISVNTDQDKNIWKIFSKKKISWVNLWNGGGYNTNLSKLYEITGFPSYFWISPNGKILRKWAGYGGPTSISQFVEQFLKQKESFHITALVSNYPEGTIFTLSQKENNQLIPIAQDTVKNQCVYFNGEVIKNTPVFLSCTSPQYSSHSCEIWIEPGCSTKVYNNNGSIETWYVANGVEEQVDLRRYLSATQSLLDSIYDIDLKIFDLNTKQSQQSTKIKNLENKKTKLKRDLMITELQVMGQATMTRTGLYKLHRYLTDSNFDISNFLELCRKNFDQLSKGEKQSQIGQEVHKILYGSYFSIPE